MYTKTYEVKLKALKTAPALFCNLSAIRAGEIVSKKVFDEIESDMSIVIKNEHKNGLRDIYGLFEYKKMQYIPDPLKLAPDRTDLNYVFMAGYELIELDLSTLDTTNITSMDNTFSDCRKLKHIELSNIDTSHVISMKGAFGNCQELTVLDFSNIDTSKVVDFRQSFYNCVSLGQIDGVIDMSSANPDKCYSMFYNCANLSKIKIKNPPIDMYKKDYFSPSYDSTIEAQFYQYMGLNEGQFEIVE